MLHGVAQAMLAQLDADWAVLSAGRYALAVRLQVHEGTVECRVPTWSGVGDLLPDLAEVMLVATCGSARGTRWLFLRGAAAVLPEPDWAGWEIPADAGAAPDELYQVVQIRPARIEWVDESRGWGVRETLDL